MHIIKFLALVVTGSWVPLHTLHAGSSEYPASFLAMKSFILIIIVGAFMSIQDFDIMKVGLITIYVQIIPSSFPSICPPQLSTLLQCHPMTTSAFSSTFTFWPFLHQLKHGPPFRRGLAVWCACRDVLFYAQNLQTIVMLLLCTGLVLALSLLFFSPENLPGRLSLLDIDQSIAHCNGTFFNKNTRALSAYAKGVLIANAIWVAWMTLALTTQAWPYRFCQELTPFVAHDGGPCMCYQCFGWLS